MRQDGPVRQDGHVRRQVRLMSVRMAPRKRNANAFLQTSDEPLIVTTPYHVTIGRRSFTRHHRHNTSNSAEGDQPPNGHGEQPL